MRAVLSREFRNLYRDPQSAYQSMDFHGRSYITRDDLLGSVVFKRHQTTFGEQELKKLLVFYNLFPL
jgi:hypothetical protein